MSTSDPRYAAVNALHAQGYPPLTREAAHHFAVQLLRHFGKPEDACATVTHRLNVMDKLSRWGCRQSYGRRCWASTKPTTGHLKGWGRLIHDVAHMVHRYRHPGFKSHATGEHAIETEIAYYVRHSTGWLVPPPAPAPFNPLVRVAQANARDYEALERWQAKYYRAERAIRKIQRRMKARERRVISSEVRAS